MCEPYVSDWINIVHRIVAIDAGVRCQASAVPSQIHRQRLVVRLMKYVEAEALRVTVELRRNRPVEAVNDSSKLARAWLMNFLTAVRHVGE